MFFFKLPIQDRQTDRQTLEGGYVHFQHTILEVYLSSLSLSVCVPEIDQPDSGTGPSEPHTHWDFPSSPYKQVNNNTLACNSVPFQDSSSSSRRPRANFRFMAVDLRSTGISNRQKENLLKKSYKNRGRIICKLSTAVASI